MLYNTALEQRITAYRRCGVTLTCYQQQAELPDLKAAFPEYAAIHRQVLQDVLTRLDKTYQAFFRRVKAGQTPGFPRFQGRTRYHSFTYKQYGNGARLDNGFLVLSKIGRIACAGRVPWRDTQDRHRLAGGGWLVCLLSCAEVPPSRCHHRTETGIDVGLKVFLITAEGDPVENPRHHGGPRSSWRKRNAGCRRKKGSRRRGKAVGQLQRAHQTVKRQRADFHHKTALKLLRQYDAISLEDLRVANMVRNRHLAKSISDAGWAAFRAILEAKAACAGRRVIAVPRRTPARTVAAVGSACPRSERAHPCLPLLWTGLDRDENAARNIQWAGQALRGLVA